LGFTTKPTKNQFICFFDILIVLLGSRGCEGIGLVARFGWSKKVDLSLELVYSQIYLDKKSQPQQICCVIIKCLDIAGKFPNSSSFQLLVACLKLQQE
jgi:hypothetical protein